MAEKRKSDVLVLQYANVDYYPPTINGIRAMADRGLSVEALCHEDWPATGVAWPDGVTVQRLGGRPPGGFKAGLFFLRFLKHAFRISLSRRPRVIYGYDLQGIAAAGIVGETLGIPYIHHCHDFYLPDEGMGRFDRRLKSLETLFSRRAESLVFPSESKAQLFSRTSGISRPYVVVANSAPRQPERRSDALQTEIRKRGGNPRHVVLYQGSIGPACGIDAAIRSMPYWPEGATLALLGIVRPDGFMDDLSALARRVGVEDRVFYLGRVGYDELLDWTCSADMGLFLPTKAQIVYMYSGTAVNKIMEYMACGVPSLVAAFPALEELMEATCAGVAVDPSDPQAVGSKVTELLTNHNKWEQCSRSARKAHLEKYHYELQFSPVLDLICRLKDGKSYPKVRRDSGAALPINMS